MSAAGGPAFGSTAEVDRWADEALQSLDSVLDEVVHNMLKDDSDDEGSKATTATNPTMPPMVPPGLVAQDTHQAIQGPAIKTVRERARASLRLDYHLR